MLEVRDLKAGYGNITVLKGISLAITEGQIVALIGANGAGKTTTLKSITRSEERRVGKECRSRWSPYH